MIIALINWRVIPDKASEFIEFWGSTLKLDGSPGLIGEFLSKVEGPDFFDKITWQMEPTETEEDKSFWKSETYASFVNVGIWESLADFDRAVGRLMNADPKAMNEYEAAPRRRAVVTPSAWRIGASKFPEASSEGVVP